MSDKNYTTEEKMENYLGDITIVAGEASSAILAAQEYIDNFTGRNFKADSIASARLYNGNDRQALIIDDCVEVTKVEVGNDSWGDNFTEAVNTGDVPQYYTLPTNNNVDNLPIRKIGLRSKVWANGNANQRITAKWGFSAEVPSDIVFVATVLASGMYYQNKGKNTGAIKSEKIGEYQVSYGDDGGFNDMKQSMEILNSYKKYEL